MHNDIEAYLNGELHGEALERFEVELARNSDLREEVELLRPTLRDLRRVAIARRVAEAGRNRAARRQVRHIVVLSCSILLGLGGVWWLWQHDSGISSPQPSIEPPVYPPGQVTPVPTLPDTLSEKDRPLIAENLPDRPKPTTEPDKYRMLAEHHYQVPAEYSGLRTVQQEDVLSEPKLAFSEKKYTEALHLLENNSAANLPEAQYLKAHILFGQKQFEQSAAAFDALAANPAAAIHKDAAEWYALLATVAQGKNAKKRLQKILAEEGHLYQENAQKLAPDVRYWD